MSKAEFLSDQWKKKAELNRTNVVLFPLSDDFHYSQNMEWKVQKNYEYNLYRTIFSMETQFTKYVDDKRYIPTEFLNIYPNIQRIVNFLKMKKNTIKLTETKTAVDMNFDS
uniref:Uncharacterized protein n=1 Tax=Glossina pallidipes TaxID=7398 RepID=A0A1B0A335_GLOPL